MATTVPLGSLVIKPTRATLFKSNSLIVSMSPYVRFTYNGKEYRSKPATSQDKFPAFADTFEFTQLGDTQIVVTLWDKSVFADDCLGETIIHFGQVFQTMVYSTSGKLHNKGKHVGDIFFDFEYRPLGVLRPQGMPPGVYQPPGFNPMMAPRPMPGPGQPFGVPPTGYGHPAPYGQPPMHPGQGPLRQPDVPIANPIPPRPQPNFGADVPMTPQYPNAYAPVNPGAPAPPSNTNYPGADPNSQSLYPNEYKIRFN